MLERGDILRVKIDRMLARSENRRHVWAYVLSKTTEEQMRVSYVDIELKSWLGSLYNPGVARLHFLSLEPLGLIEPAKDSELSGKPYRKTNDVLWDSVADMLTGHGMHLPLGPIGEQLCLPIPHSNMVSPEPEPAFEPIQLELFYTK